MRSYPAVLSRIQFAFTVSFHIIFPSITIGLATLIALWEGLWLKTGNPVVSATGQILDQTFCHHLWHGGSVGHCAVL